MSEVAISVEAVSKRYRIGKSHGGRTFREALAGAVSAPFRLSDQERDESEFWALKDVSFEVKRGEVLGIIGRNGAGKSTLLKILSRITEPTSGRAEVFGRVGSLLEVGTGFHPELTGRENIYLNGAILGMRRREIDRQFDEIVDFAEVERFIDTPVKHYSSGMYVRLAFAVAAHLEPEILIVDEVLAVGDAAFQRKCLGKLAEASYLGRTALFVSHNMAAVQSLTNRCALLSSGTVVTAGPTAGVTAEYFRTINSSVPAMSSRLSDGPPSGQASALTSVELLCNGENSAQVVMGDSLAVRVNYLAKSPVRRATVGIGIETEHGVRVVSTNSHWSNSQSWDLDGRGQIYCDLGKLPLNQGTYFVKLVLADSVGESLETFERTLKFQVVASDTFGSGKLPTVRQGVIYWPAVWTMQKVS